MGSYSYSYLVKEIRIKYVNYEVYFCKEGREVEVGGGKDLSCSLVVN